MPIPLALLGLGGTVLSKLIGGGNIGYQSPPSPQFFGPQFDQYLSSIKQAHEAAYGGAGTSMIESLNNMGYGQSGAIPQGLTNLNIQKGQDIAGATSGAIGQEYGLQQGFNTGAGYAEAGHKSALDYAHSLDQRSNQMESLKQIFGLLGAGLNKDKTTPIAGTQDPNDPSYWWPGGAGDTHSRVHDILKLMFGL
jgi:hypothetical protein